MEMERTRRSVDRTRELAVKKPRLADDADRDRDRAAAALPSRERPAIPRGGGASADPRFRASERQREEAAKGGGGGYQPQPPQQQQMQELVAEYKTALAELTFNSKPIITNLTIIAGENIHAAKVIAATICAHILEVPSDQKLPSLYLLDSIVKNIGRDYIKYFAARLPEVFCKAYRQVDPSIHSGMKHLYGTWKGVFPPTPLQLIEKELFATAVNNSSSRTDASNASQTRPSHSIHVNPKYLEARQRLQQSSHPKVTNNDSRDSSINSAEDLDRPDRTSSSGNARSWVDASPDTQNNQYPLREGSETSRKSSILVDRNLEYESDIPQYPDLKIGRTSKAVMGMERPGIDGSLYPTSRTSLETSVEQRNGFDYPLAKYKEARPSQILQQLPSTQTGILRGNQVSSRSWKNSEEEEYMWDDMGSKFADHAEKTDTWKRERNFEDPQKQANVGRSKWNEPYWNKFDNSQLEKSSGDERFPTVMEFDEKPSFSRKQSDGRLIARRESYPDSMYTEEAIPRARNPSAILHQESLPAVSFTQSSVFSRLSSQSESHQAPLSTGLSVSFKSSLSNEGLNPSSLGISSSSSTLQSNAPFQHMKTRIPSLDHQHSQLDSQNNQTQMPISGQLDRSLLSKFAPEVFQPRTSSRIQPPQINPQPTAFRNSQSGETSLPYTPYETQNRPSVQHQSHYEQLLPPKESKPQLAGETGRPLSLGMSSQIGGSLAPSNSSSETGNTSNAAELLAAIMKSKHVSSNATGDLHNPNPQPPLPGGPPPMPTVLPSISVLRSTTDSVPSSSCNNSLSLEVPRTVNPPLPPGPPPHSSIVVQLANSMDTNLNPLSSLLSSLVAKGIITSQGNQTQLKDGPECDDGVQMLNKLPFKTSNFSASNPGNAVSTVDTLPVASSSNELSPVEEVIVLSKQQTEDLKDLIGFEFRPDIIRSLHDTVINALFDDMKHQCRKCGLRFRLQDKLDEHIHSHDLRRLGVTSQASQKWFPSLTEFLSGCLSRHSDSLNSSVPVEIAPESAGSEPMVPADESQCICAFCAEPFEDVYCLVKNIWMYKGTVYMKPAVGMQNVRGLDTDKKSALIVHVKCMPERLKEGL